MARDLRDRLQRVQRRVRAIPGCECSDPNSSGFRMYVVEVCDDVISSPVEDPGPCPLCGAPALRVELVETGAREWTDREQAAAQRQEVVGWRQESDLPN